MLPLSQANPRRRKDRSPHSPADLSSRHRHPILVSSLIGAAQSVAAGKIFLAPRGHAPTCSAQVRAPPRRRFRRRLKAVTTFPKTLPAHPLSFLRPVPCCPYKRFLL